MSKLITKVVIKVLIAILLCTLISFVVTAFAPHISNDVALGQLQNDDMSFTIMQTWNQVLNLVGWVQAGIAIVCGIAVGRDTYKYFKNRKENEKV